MITVTGATGQLGRLVITGLLDSGVPAGEVTALVRDAARAGDLADRGVRVAVADYTDRASLEEALAGTDRLLLVSGSEVGQRVAQHTNVVEAAKAAGVGLLVYTSAPKADATTLVLAPEHAATEEVIRASGLPAVVLRNNWYWENYDAQIGQAAATGEVVGSAGQGRAWPASRADFAAAAVAVLTADDPQPAVHELGGDDPFTLADLAAEVGRQAGREVTHRDLSTDEHVAALRGAGLDEGTAGFVAALDGNIAAGELDAGQGGISALTGRPTRTLAEHVALVLGSS
ncbi:NAD(P)H-binding protein [Klenkia taihuensis]|uniref:NAD(P)H dehydrogenase (Quinone) n=1 Tax=Klenkia taihuensis TaxID=1225127 RepID=A0A1I1VAR3_9ACTN|nr:NAD(P)H-binding protein [Klenkia taihuensis]GHE14473.1 NAD(P)-dependent oxidoreductase [Klenkia taihuensis]SFD79058.1 NAD(P)H dehydrogenase (quinone) [Klenkia taihuensis]